MGFINPAFFRWGTGVYSNYPGMMSENPPVIKHGLLVTTHHLVRYDFPVKLKPMFLRDFPAGHVWLPIIYIYQLYPHQIPIISPFSLIILLVKSSFFNGEPLKHRKVLPNVISYGAALSSCEKCGEWQQLLCLLQEKQNCQWLKQSLRLTCTGSLTCPSTSGPYQNGNMIIIDILSDHRFFPGPNSETNPWFTTC